MNTATRCRIGNPSTTVPHKARKSKAMLPPVWHDIVSREEARVRLKCITRLDVSELNRRMFMVQEGLPLPKDVVAAIHENARQVQTQAEVDFRYRSTVLKLVVDAWVWKSAGKGRPALAGRSAPSLLGKEFL